MQRASLKPILSIGGPSMGIDATSVAYVIGLLNNMLRK